MEEKKLLPILNWLIKLILLTFTNVQVCSASAQLQNGNDGSHWEQEALKQAQSLLAENITAKFMELKKQQGQVGQFEQLVNPAATLRLFVSSSMPTSLLRYYHQAAVKYGGVIVFNGLPQGSFKELARLVKDIVKEGEEGRLQIDDEAFKRFAVTVVPTIVLSKENFCWSEELCKITFDKVSGNIGVQSALAKFARLGDLAVEAGLLLPK